MSRVLVIDDDTSLAWLAKAALARFGGHDVDTAKTVEEGLALARSRAFDVILVDGMMPGRDGASFLEAARADAALAAIPIVMLTARSAAADRAYYVGLGARGVLAKPFDPRTLSAQLSEILESHS